VHNRQSSSFGNKGAFLFVFGSKIGQFLRFLV